MPNWTLKHEHSRVTRVPRVFRLFGQWGNVGMAKKPEDSGNEIGTVRGKKKTKNTVL